MAKSSDKILQEYEQAFKLFDKDNNGTIDANELRTVMKQFGTELTETEVADLMHEVDDNNNGEIDFKEFMILM
tara:strand:+ start:153 stop:371 length:219 start_codon:yes stop_codon:yes gene_type:complete